MSRNVRKCTFWHVRPEKIQISLRIRAVWSESSMGTLSIVMDAKLVRADNEDSDQTVDAQADLSLRCAYKVRSYAFWRCIL